MTTHSTGLLLGLLLCAAAAPCAEPGNPAQFRAGAAASNITPPLGKDIIGGFHPFPSKQIHDQLWARCLVLDDGRTRIGLVVCDILGLAQPLCAEARRLAEEQSGMPQANLLISATHTHSASSALGTNRFAAKPDLDEYQRFVAGRIADSVRCAIANLAPAQVGWTTAQEPRHVFNRRWFMKPGSIPPGPLGTQDQVKMNPPRRSPDLVKPAGPTDPEICVLAVRSPEGRPIALMANYSLHYVGGVGAGDISADYYGMFCDRIQQLLGADRLDPPFVAVLSNGTSGNINNIDFTKPSEKLPPYARMREVANDVAQDVHSAYGTIQWHDSAPLAAAIAEPDIAFRHPTPEDIGRAKAILARRDPASKKPAPLEEIYADRTLKVAESPDRAPIRLQALRVGDLAIGTIPCEVFVETGLELKRKSPFKPTFVVSLAQGYFGYLPTPEHHRLGGYETWLGTNRLEIEAEPKIATALLGLFARLKDDVR
ncbi:MAG TPA: hypothetical protein PLU30_16000 [Verrucomicrobiae bacterium]|nr:hypothetical protein [Verrucomicrobiae bacterium]